ncbi:MAG: SGNH/GDSL hydrolase family protein [Verrucomicrobia bacterium]|nr:SGNH/GDSL hydrolase family protein [Verrucomicrobiota bacterium]
MKKLAWLVFWFAGCILQVPPADAFDLSKFNQLVIFGDSLSDNGNAYFLTNGQTPAGPPLSTGPYYEGRWSDGPIWVDDFPSIAGLPQPITPFFADPVSGTNVAVGGSTSSPVVHSASTSSTPLTVQISAFVAEHGGRIPGNDLYLIWIGADDFLLAGNRNPNITVAGIAAGIAQLREAGARACVLVTVPDVSVAPSVKAAGLALAAKNFVSAVNTGLQTSAPFLAWVLGIQLELVDMNPLLYDVVNNPGKHGFSNSSGYALDPSTGGGDMNKDDYVFFDGLHPTQGVHMLLAEFFYEAITGGNAVPGGTLAFYP